MNQRWMSVVVLSAMVLGTSSAHAQQAAVARNVSAQGAAGVDRAALRKVAAPAAELSGGAATAPPTAVTLARSTSVARGGRADPVAEQARRIQALRGARPAASVTSVAAAGISASSLPGIHSVDGQARLNFEPGGRYLISGSGFGERSGRVTLRPAGDSRPIELKVITWKNTDVFVEVPADISGVKDYPTIELTVASPSGRPLSSNRYGFYAARELVKLAGIPRDALRTDHTVVGDGLKVNHALGGAAGTFSVARYMLDPDRSGCYERPIDTFFSDKIPLAPGFEVYSLDWTHDTLRNVQTNATHETGFFSYQAQWHNERSALLRSGIQRVYAKKYVNPVEIFKWLSTMGHYDAFKPGQAACTSRYVVTVNVSGPRGLSPSPGGR